MVLLTVENTRRGRLTPPAAAENGSVMLELFFTFLSDGNQNRQRKPGARTKNDCPPATNLIFSYLVRTHLGERVSFRETLIGKLKNKVLSYSYFPLKNLSVLWTQ